FLRKTSLDEIPQLFNVLKGDMSLVGFAFFIFSICSKLEQIKNAKPFKKIHIILVADEFNENEKLKALKIGANDYLPGDVSCEELALRIDFVKKLNQLKATNTEEEKAVSEDLKPHFWQFKRTVDILVSGFALLLASPIMLIIAIAVKLDSRGPVFYVSKRAGKGYKIFDFYKFRTMSQGADSQLDQLHHLNQYSGNEEGENNDSGANPVFFKVKNDPRITKLGGFLRKTSLDEIPQLFNVLKGDMSLVGNRPLPLYEAEKLTQDQWAMRFLAPAGITGLWQITKRGQAEMSEEERVALDMEYAEKNSFWYDMKIMLKTPMALVQKEEV
ncbi:MAG: sugar transferase, partial [Bacteroidota bacterium]